MAKNTWSLDRLFKEQDRLQAERKKIEEREQALHKQKDLINSKKALIFLTELEKVGVTFNDLFMMAGLFHSFSNEKEKYSAIGKQLLAKNPKSTQESIKNE